MGLTEVVSLKMLQLVYFGQKVIAGVLTPTLWESCYSNNSFPLSLASNSFSLPHFTSLEN